MEARAVLKYARISPRKVEIVLDLIRNKPVDLAMAILKHTPKAACEDLEKLLKSARSQTQRTTSTWIETTSMLPSATFARVRCSSESARELRDELTEF